MISKMKTRRPVALRTTSRRATTVSLQDIRRDFFKDILQRIQDLPDDVMIPPGIRDDIQAYSRSRGSESNIIKVVEYPTYAVKKVFSELLQNLDGDISPVINKLLKEIRFNDETLKYMSQDTKRKHKLAEYVRQNLSKYLPIATENQTDVPLEQLEKDLHDLDEDDDVFHPLFHSFIPEDRIKTFLANVDFTNSLYHQISKFIKQHRFYPIQKLFETGFKPTSPQDWKDALPSGYYEKFPNAFWKLKEWDQFAKFMELSNRYSLNLNDFIKFSFYKDNERLIRLGEQIRSSHDKTTAVPIRPSSHAPFMKIVNENQLAMLQRSRPWINGLVSVLIQPIKDCDIYIGNPYSGYFFPNDIFYKTLANPLYECVQQKNTRIFFISYQGIRSQCYIYHLLKDGQIVPQSWTDYEKGVEYLSGEHYQLRIPKIEDYFLSLPFYSLSPHDQDFFRNLFIPDISFFLTLVYNDPINTDKIASHIVEGMLEKTKHKPLKECLGHAFSLYFLLNPRYNFNLLTDVFKERMNLFFYNLENIDELPVEFYYPQYHFLEDEKKHSFDMWVERCRNIFITEKLYYLFSKNYPILKIKIPEIVSASSTPPKNLILNVETGEKIVLLYPYQKEYIYLPEVAGSIMKNQEYSLHNKPLPNTIIRTMERFFDLGRVQVGLGAIFLDHDYEIMDSGSQHTILSPNQTDSNEQEDKTIPTLETLPNFKENAYKFLELLSVQR